MSEQSGRENENRKGNRIIESDNSATNGDGRREMIRTNDRKSLMTSAVRPGWMKIPFSMPFVFAERRERTSQSDHFDPLSTPLLYKFRFRNPSFPFCGVDNKTRSVCSRERGSPLKRDSEWGYCCLSLTGPTDGGTALPLRAEQIIELFPYHPSSLMLGSGRGFHGRQRVQR